MTTQHLQEAEELADQVALLDMGKIVAKGSVDEIKKRFGIGYQLILDEKDDGDRVDILNHIKGATQDEKNSNQFLLPF